MDRANTVDGAKTPVRLQVTFDGLRGDQLERRWLAEVGGTEAYVFDGDQLAEDGAWQVLRDNLAVARDLGADPLTLHFPTDNADWVHDPAMHDNLLRFCDIAAEAGADGVVLHANQFVGVDDWPSFDLAGVRARVVDRLAGLDERLGGSPLWIGVENMPVIGSAGIDFDSVFVLPGDFDGIAELGSPRIGVTWDVCHWAVTYTTLRSIAHLRQEKVDVGPLDLPAAPLRHVHFGSFTGHALPFWPGECFEGATPQQGECDQALLSSMLAEAITRSAPGTSVVFEVQETDYLDRRSCWDTLAWVAADPVLSTIARTEKSR